MSLLSMSSQVFDVDVVDAVDVNIPQNVSNAHFRTAHFSSVSANIRYDISIRIVLFVAMFCKFTPETSGLTFQVCKRILYTETVKSTPVSSYFTTKHRAKYAQIICAVEER